MKLHNTKRFFALSSLIALSVGLALGVNAQSLTHRYSFNDPAGSQTFEDSVGGTNWNGTLVNDGGGAAYLDGSSLQLDGARDFGVLPAGIMTNDTQITVEVWADFSSNNAVWTRVFSFGDQNSSGGKNSGIDYCHYAGGNYQNLDALSTNGGDTYANSTPGLNGTTNNHITVVVDPVNTNMYYYNGISIVSAMKFNPAPPSPLAEMNDTDNEIGRSLYDTDPTLAGAIHELRVYQGVLSPQLVALNDASGPDNYITSPGSIISLHFSSPANPFVINQTAPQTLTGDFTGVTNLNLVAYGGVVYSSANTNVLKISTNGVVKAVGAGTTTVTATYGSLSATNTLTVLSLPTTMIHRYSFASDASDSIGGANGTLNGNATVSGGQLVLDGSAGTYVSLPAGLINIATNASVTFEAWTTIGAISEWSHLFEFGNIAASCIYCAPRADAGGFHEFGLSEDFPADGQTLSWAHGWSNVTLHYTGVVDPTTSTLAVYTNGVLLQASYTANAPVSSIATNFATFGQSSFGDPYAVLSIDEFRVYSGALSPAQVAMSDLSGPNSTNFNPGALSSITVAATNYPAFASAVAPVIWATYANLTNFNLLPNLMAMEAGLVVTSGDASVVSVNSQNMLTTLRPGTVTLTAAYLGKTNSTVVRVSNQSVLTHRYSFTTDDSDSVGGANGTNEGTASVSGGQLQLDGGSGDYVALPGGLLSTYRSATIDVWATISGGQQHWSRLWEFADVGPATANELYFAPAWNSAANAAFLSDGAPFGGGNLGPESPPLVNQTVHLTCLVADGSLDLYTNGVLYLSTAGLVAPANQAGNVGSWIGYSPYGDPGIDGSVDEYRIYKGRLSPEEIQASDLLGPDEILSTTNATLSASGSGGNIVLSWPVASAGFTVETKPSLDLGTSWTTLTNTPILIGNQWQLTVPNSGTNQFYRLIR
jgi:hypothetical protein